MSIVQGDGSMFGWTMVHVGDQLYVGAPKDNNRGGWGVRHHWEQTIRNHYHEWIHITITGSVHKISNLKTSPSQSPMGTSTTPREEAWFGGSLAASGTEIFACGNREDHQSLRYGVGKCYKAPSTGNTFTFTTKTNHPFGYPVTAIAYENNLVIGVPWSSRVARYSGSRFIEMRWRMFLLRHKGVQYNLIL